MRHGHAIRLAVRLLDDALQLDIERGERLVLQQQARLALLFQRARLVDADAAIDGEGRQDDAPRRPAPPASARGGARVRASPLFPTAVRRTDVVLRPAACRAGRSRTARPPAVPGPAAASAACASDWPAATCRHRSRISASFSAATAWRDRAACRSWRRWTTAPLAMWTICSACSARARLCVTRISVVPRLAVDAQKLVHDLDLGLLVEIGGRLVGQHEGGSLISARAITARRCSPAEISDG